MTDYQMEATPAVDADIEAAFAWYESEEPDLGFEFLEEVRAVYQRILQGPFKYQELRSGIRRALTRRFPYGIYFSIRGPSHRDRCGVAYGPRSRRMATSRPMSKVELPRGPKRAIQF